MRQKIIDSIEKIEREKDVKVLLACETGSRGWGFPSPDSDFDVRMIYLQRPERYLTLVEGKDSIEMMLDDREIDISGWDLRKALRLLLKSNASLLERLQSPIIYKADHVFLTRLNSLSHAFYSRIATLHHYLNMAKKSFAEIKANKDYKLKRLFYALRAATACKWILELERKPPIEFNEMLRHLELDKALVARIDHLVRLKSTKSEAYLHQGEGGLFQFISSCIAVSEAGVQSLPAAQGKVEVLDRFFVDTLNSQWK